MSERILLDRIVHTVKTEEKESEAARKRSVGVDQTMSLLKSLLSSHLSALLGKKASRRSGTTKFSSGLRQKSSVSTPQAFLSVLLCSWMNFSSSCRSKAPAGERAKMRKLDYRRSELGRLATAAEMKLCREEHCPRVYKAAKPRSGSLQSFLAKQKSLSS